MKYIISLITSVVAFASISGQIPNVSILKWDKSLDIEDVSGNRVTLNHARIIDRYVNGVIPEHDASYDSYRMELVASFDRDISANSVRMYGQIYSTGNDAIWWLIETFTGEKIRKCWKPIEIPAVRSGQKIDLIRTMLGSDFAVKYNASNILSTPYAISFVDWIQTFYCGIYCLDNSSFGAICTIDIVLINDTTSERKTIGSFSYFITDGSYAESKEWFNARVGWYRQIPKDFGLGYNCLFGQIEDSLYISAPGIMEIDGIGYLNILHDKFRSKKNRVTNIVSKLKKTDNLFSSGFDQMIAYWESEADYNKTAACTFYIDNGRTNLCGLAKCGRENRFVKLQPLSQVDFSGEFVVVEIDVVRENFSTYARYKVNNVPYTYNGSSYINVVDHSRDQQKIYFYGTTTLIDIYGDTIRDGGLNLSIE